MAEWDNQTEQHKAFLCKVIVVEYMVDCLTV